MARPKKRPHHLHVSFNAEVFQLLTELGQLQGVKPVVVVSDLLETLTPQLRSTVETMKLALRMETEQKKALAAALEEHANQLESSIAYISGNIEKDVKQFKLPIK